MMEDMERLHEAMKNVYLRPIVIETVSGMDRLWWIFDHPAWYESRQKDLETVWPPRGT